MHVFETLLVLLLGATVLSTFARRLKAIATLGDDNNPKTQGLRHEYAYALQVARGGRDPRDSQKNVLRLKLVAAGRKAIDDLRNSGVIGDTGYRRAKEELDQLELSVRIVGSDCANLLRHFFAKTSLAMSRAVTALGQPA